MYEAAFDELDGTHGGLMMWKHFYFYFYFGGGRSANIVHALFTCLIEKDLTWSPFFLDRTPIFERYGNSCSC